MPPVGRQRRRTVPAIHVQRTDATPKQTAATKVAFEQLIDALVREHLAQATGNGTRHDEQATTLIKERGIIS